MRNTTAALLIGAGAGLVLAWLFRGRLGAMLDAPAEIVVEPGEGGRPRVSFVTPSVTVKTHRHVSWMVINRSTHDAGIALADWQDLGHRPAPPAVDPDPDDHEHPPQNGLSRSVPAGKRRPIRGRARAPQGGAFEEHVKYSVYLGADLAVDPIVKLIL
jgi:hypothetical protein